MLPAFLQEYEDDVRLSVLGGCAVPDDGSGVWVRPARMTLAELSTELRAANIQVGGGLAGGGDGSGSTFACQRCGYRVMSLGMRAANIQVRRWR
jgi:hypothetical protein